VQHQRHPAHRASGDKLDLAPVRHGDGLTLDFHAPMTSSGRSVLLSLAFVIGATVVIQKTIHKKTIFGRREWER
jgi:hypothetical protein